MEFCNYCRAIVPRIQRDFIPSKSARGKTRSINHGTISEVLESAGSCPGCSFIKQILEKQEMRYEPDGHVEILYDQMEYYSKEDEIFRLRPFSSIYLWLPVTNRKNPMGSGNSSVHLHAYVEEHSSLASDGIVGGRPISPANDGVTPRLWLSQCLEKHPDCLIVGEAESLGDTPHPLPTRVLDLGDGLDLEFCRLIETRGVPTSAYVALSYCWGKGAICKTTKLNMKGHKARVAWADMNQTYRDAIDMTRALGIRYLWIDALCIIQDDHDDWEREASIMASVYQNAIVTFSAAQGTTADGGLFLPRSDYLGQFFPTGEGSRDGLFLSEQMYNAKGFYQDVQEGSLSRRGWTLQERLLSRRLLHFGTDQLHWECQTTLASEKSPLSRAHGTRPGVDPATVFSSRAVYGVYGLGDLKDSLGPSTKVLSMWDPSVAHERAVVSAWYTLVNAYSKRLITNPSDKLTAMAGLTEIFKRRFGENIVWGLPMSDKTGALMWSVKRGTQIVPERAPSWSWAAVDGEIEFRIPLEGEYLVAIEQVDFTDRTCVMTVLMQTIVLAMPSAQEIACLKCNVRVDDVSGNKVGYGVLDTDPGQSRAADSDSSTADPDSRQTPQRPLPRGIVAAMAYYEDEEMMR